MNDESWQSTQEDQCCCRAVGRSTNQCYFSSKRHTCVNCTKYLHIICMKDIPLMMKNLKIVMYRKNSHGDDYHPRQLVVWPVYKVCTWLYTSQGQPLQRTVNFLARIEFNLNSQGKIDGPIISQVPGTYLVGSSTSAQDAGILSGIQLIRYNQKSSGPFGNPDLTHCSLYVESTFYSFE